MLTDPDQTPLISEELDNAQPPPTSPVTAKLPKSPVGFALSPYFVADAPQLSPFKGGRSE